MPTKIRSLLMLVAVTLIPALVWAAPPTVSNGSFEAPDISPANADLSSSPTSWTSDASSGILSIQDAGSASGQDGDQSGLCVADASILQQSIGGTVENGGSYCMTIQIGDRDSQGFRGGTISLEGAGGEDCGSSNVTMATPGDGGFVNQTICVGGGGMGSTVTCPGNTCCGLGLRVTVTCGSTAGQTLVDNVVVTPVDLQSFSIE